MESLESANPTQKRPLEEDTIEGPSERPQQIQKVSEGEETGVVQSSDVNAEAKSSRTGARGSERGRGKKSKVPMSRRAARDAKNLDSRRGTRPERAEGEERKDEEGESSKGPRLPKRQCALLLGFCGSGYSGMQFQPHGPKTIEGTLWDALIKAGAVSQDNADSITKVNFSRAARTDAGVHAAGNLVSMKMITTVPGTPDLVARINEELPPEIRLWGFERVLKSFNARNTCDSRKYTYYFPSYLLISPKPGSGLHQMLSGQLADGSSPASHSFWDGISTESTKLDDLERKRHFRTSPESVELLRSLARKYEGSRNFHNFTVGRQFTDPSCVRIMKKIEVADPVVHGTTEWIAVMFHGQSFMLHQRKMMTILVLCARTNTPPQVIDELYGPRTVFVPKMPALGLLLEYPIFESYNRRLAESMAKVDEKDPEYRRAIDFEIHREKIDNFKQEHIYSRMRAIEEQGAIFDAWIRSVDSYHGNDLLYLNSNGIIPEAAVIKKHGRRANPFREKKRFDATTFPAGADVGKLMEEEETKDIEEDDDEEERLNKRELADMEG